ncbi:MAG: hypothetical protein CMJ54_06575 [Planctomycetaceae bacterium]|nr:hypothetical protein [Planctomycetaceae bacterium]
MWVGAPSAALTQPFVIPLMSTHLLARSEVELAPAREVAAVFGMADASHGHTMQGALGPDVDPGSDDPGHALMPEGVVAGDDLVVAPSLSLFDAPAHRSLLRHWASFVGGGRIIVPESTIAGGLGGGGLDSVLGPPIEVETVAGRCWRAFRGVDWQAGGTPIDWWHARGGAVVEANARIKDSDLRRNRLDLAHPGIFLDAGDDAVRTATTSTANELGAAWGYHVWASLAKIAVLRWLLRDFEMGDSMDHVDLGPGPGLVGASLVLDPSIPIHRSTGLELRAIGPWSGCRLAGPAEESLRDRWRFRLGSASNWTSDESLGVFTAIGSLLYLPRSESESLLERVWDRLVPGGLLVIHENMKHPRFVADHKVMFDRVELDRLLGRFGSISHVSATACRRLRPDQVGDKTVFRVVRKRG